MATVTMREIREGEVPFDGGTAIQEDPDRPAFRGNGPDDYVCVRCGNVLAESHARGADDEEGPRALRRCSTVNVAVDRSDPTRPESRQQRRRARLDLLAQRQAPRPAGAEHAVGVRVAAALRIALGRDEHVWLQRGSWLPHSGQRYVRGRPPPEGRITYQRAARKSAVGDERAVLPLQVRVLVDRQQVHAAGADDELRQAAVDHHAVDGDERRVGGAQQRGADRPEHAARGHHERGLAGPQRRGEVADGVARARGEHGHDSPREMSSPASIQAASAVSRMRWKSLFEAGASVTDA